MEQIHQVFTAMPWLLPVLVILFIWETIWKIIGMWKAARNNNLAWFLIIAFVNSLGVLSIFYILKYKNKDADNA